MGVIAAAALSDIPTDSSSKTEIMDACHCLFVYLFAFHVLLSSACSSIPHPCQSLGESEFRTSVASRLPGLFTICVKHTSCPHIVENMLNMGLVEFWAVSHRATILTS